MKHTPDSKTPTRLALLGLSAAVLALAACGGGSTVAVPGPESNDAPQDAAALRVAGERRQPTAAQAWTLCASEGGTCSYTGTRPVRYGSATTYVARLLPGPTPCSNAVFGDPVRNVAKSCWVGGTPREDAPTPAPAPPPPPPPPPPGAALVANRLSGPAPLAVHVDATALGAFNGVYEFDFGDAAAGSWAVSGQPRNTQRGGPIAAHVYDRPGTYTVRVGGSTLTITVQDADAVFAGINTVCVSTAARYDGCPAGAVTQTALPGSYAGKRVLLRRGERFGTIAPRATDSGFQVGAFGAGARPDVAGVYSGMPAPGGVVTSDWTVMDLSIGTGAVSVEASTSRFLLYRNDIVRYGDSVSMINIGTAAAYYQSHGHPALEWPREVFVVDNEVLGVVGTSRGTAPNITAMGYFVRSALLGNTMDRAYEHTLRIWATSKTVIAHNAFGGNHRAESDGIGIRQAMKLHSGGEQPFTTAIANSLAPFSNQVVVANNRFGSPTYPGSWLVGLAPQNLDQVEGLEDFVTENNVFVHGPTTTMDVVLFGRRMTQRGNSVQGGGTPVIERLGTPTTVFPPGWERWDGPYITQ